LIDEYINYFLYIGSGNFTAPLSLSRPAYRDLSIIPSSNPAGATKASGRYASIGSNVLDAVQASELENILARVAVNILDYSVCYSTKEDSLSLSAMYERLKVLQPPFILLLKVPQGDSPAVVLALYVPTAIKFGNACGNEESFLCLLSSDESDEPVIFKYEPGNPHREFGWSHPDMLVFGGPENSQLNLLRIEGSLKQASCGYSSTFKSHPCLSQYGTNPFDVEVLEVLYNTTNPSNSNSYLLTQAPHTVSSTRMDSAGNFLEIGRAGSFLTRNGGIPPAAVGISAPHTMSSTRMDAAGNFVDIGRAGSFLSRTGPIDTGLRKPSQSKFTK
jgi:hypothetical protein